MATQGADFLVGTTANDKLTGHQGDDFFDLTNSTGTDTINGQGGRDTAIFAGSISDYTLSFKETGNDKGTVTGHGLIANLKMVEKLVFDDATYDVASGAALVTTVSISNAATVTEGDSNLLVFELTRTGDLSQALDVFYTVGGTANEGSDYAIGSHAVQFASGSATASINLPVTNDTAVEAAETVAINLSASSHYQIGGTGSGTGTILSDDMPPVLAQDTFVWHLLDGGNVIEDNSFFIEVTRTSGDRETSFPVVVIRDGSTATPFPEGSPSNGGNDFSLYSDPVRFGAGETTKIVQIGYAHFNPTYEGVEYAKLDLLADVAGGFQISPDGPSTLTIYDLL